MVKIVEWVKHKKRSASTTRIACRGTRLVHLTGIEPALSCENMDLNHTRLPVPPQVQICNCIWWEYKRRLAAAYRVTLAVPEDSMQCISRFDRCAFSNFALSPTGCACSKSCQFRHRCNFKWQILICHLKIIS